MKTDNSVTMGKNHEKKAIAIVDVPLVYVKISQVVIIEEEFEPHIYYVKVKGGGYYHAFSAEDFPKKFRIIT